MNTSRGTRRSRHHATGDVNRDSMGGNVPSLPDVTRKMKAQAKMTGKPVTLTFDDGKTFKYDPKSHSAPAGLRNKPKQQPKQIKPEQSDAIQAWLRECCDLRNDGGFSHPGYLGADPGRPCKPSTKFAFKAGPGPKLFSEPPMLRGAYDNRGHTFRDEARGVRSWRQAGKSKPLDTVPSWVPCPPPEKAKAVRAPRFRIGKPVEQKPRTMPPEPYEDAERARRAIDRGIKRPQTATGRKPFSSATKPKDLFNEVSALRPKTTPATRAVRAPSRGIKRPVFRNKRDFFGDFPKYIPDPPPKPDPKPPIRQCMVSCWTTSGVSKSIMIK